MKQVRITEREPRQAGCLYWYVLEAVAPRSADGAPLQHAGARNRWTDRSQVDPGERRKALASLNAWAQENGWTVVA